MHIQLQLLGKPSVDSLSSQEVCGDLTLLIGIVTE